MTYIYADFEYNDRAVLLGCFLNGSTGEATEIDFRTSNGKRQLENLKAKNPSAIWCAYAAMAEMSSFLRLGVDLDGMQWIDLMAEASMISGTHEAFLLKRPKLLNHLSTFQVREASADDEKRKNDMRDLILSDVDFTDEQWADIVRYCWSDVDPLPALHLAISEVHRHDGTGYHESDAINRGEYERASTILEHRSRGLPVDVPLITRICKHKDDVRAALSLQIGRAHV